MTRRYFRDGAGPEDLSRFFGGVRNHILDLGGRVAARLEHVYWELPHSSLQCSDVRLDFSKRRVISRGIFAKRKCCVDVDFTVPLLETLSGPEDMLQQGLGHRVTNPCARVGEGTNMSTEIVLAEYRKAAPTVVGKADALRYLTLCTLSSHLKYHQASGKGLAFRLSQKQLLEGKCPIRASARARRRISSRTVLVSRGVRRKFCKDVGSFQWEMHKAGTSYEYLYVFH